MRKYHKESTMYAVIKTGGKQYRVAAKDVVTIEKLAVEAGSKVEFTEVLMVGGGDGSPKMGAPLVSGAKVLGEVVDQSRAPKVIAFKKRRRKNSRRKRGHRQHQTRVRITEIVGA
jgi:large subunit ribosomal protein L21